MQKLKKNWAALHENHVLLVTTNSNERRAMLDRLDRYQKLTTGSLKQRAYLGHCSGSLVVVLDGDGGFASEDAATRFAMRYLRDASHPRPSMVLIGGVCWGNPTEVKTGDVIVCGAIESANRSTARADGSEVKFYRFESSIEPADLLAGIEPQPRCGDLISLEVRLSDRMARDKLLEKKPSALGGEMEAFALVPECRDFPWLVVKAVSDFATVVEGREEQAEAAEHASHVVMQLLKCFQTTTQADHEEQTTAAATSLVRALEGESVVISHDQFHPDEHRFTAAMQKMFSDQILISTTTRTNAVAVNARLAEDVTSLLLEVASNAFRHGRAKTVSIEFGLDGVEYSDDATEFDLQTLNDGPGRGGHSVYKRFRTQHVDAGSVEIKSSASPKGNRMSIRVPHDIADLPDIIAECSAEFDRAALLQGQHALNWSNTCQTVFVDVDALMMMSVVFDVCDDITAPVHAGLQFVLLCSDADKIGEIRSRYPDAIATGQIRFIPAP